VLAASQSGQQTFDFIERSCPQANAESNFLRDRCQNGKEASDKGAGRSSAGSGAILTLEDLAGLSIALTESEHGRTGTATHAVVLPETKPRAVGELGIVAPIGRCDIVGG
jgi:hypothetical protein